MTHHTSAVTEKLLCAALVVAAAKGYNRMTRDDVAVEAGVSPALVSLRLGTMEAMRRRVMRAAVRRSVTAVVAQGLVARDRFAESASVDLREKAARSLCSG